MVRRVVGRERQPIADDYTNGHGFVATLYNVSSWVKRNSAPCCAATVCTCRTLGIRIRMPSHRRRITFRVATSVRDDSATLERTGTTCERTALSGVGWGPTVTVIAARVEISESSATDLRLTLSCSTQIVNGDLTGDSAAWTWTTATRWRLSRYSRNDIDGMAPERGQAPQPTPFVRPPMERQRRRRYDGRDSRSELCLTYAARCARAGFSSVRMKVRP